MDAMERERAFERALGNYRQGRLYSAVSTLRRLVDGGSRDPAHLSYFGLLLGLTHKDTAESLRLCEEAVAKDGRRSSLLYLNLARALTACGRRREAIDTLSRGLLIHPGEVRLRRELQHLVPRERPVLPSLDRANALNKCLGLMRTMGRRVRTSLRPPTRGH